MVNDSHLSGTLGGQKTLHGNINSPNPVSGTLSSSESMQGTLSYQENLHGTLGSPQEITGTLAGALLRGFSAYDIARLAGFEGSEEEWLQSLICDSIDIEVVSNTPSEYIIQLSTPKATVTSPNLKGFLSQEDIDAISESMFDLLEPATNSEIEEIFRGWVNG